MAEAARQQIIRRKLDVGREAAPDDRRVLPARALSNALSKSAEELMGLALATGNCSERIGSLPDLLERLPEDGLLAVLEGPRDGQGLAAFDSSALSAIIEKLMTGKVGSSPPSPRRVTRTDAMLAADLIDHTLQRFETALAGREESRWASGFGFSSHVEDIRPLGLLLEEIDYRIFGVMLDFEFGRRTGQMILALPALGRADIAPGPNAAATPGRAADPAWSPGLAARVLQGEVRLEAVLHRFRLPISEVGRLCVGDEIPIPVPALDNVRLSGAESVPLGRCRLGCSKGFRAVRLGAEGAQETDGSRPAHVAALSRGNVPEPRETPGVGDLPDLPGRPGGGGDGEHLATPMALDGLPDIGGEPVAAALDLDALEGLPKIG